MVSIKLISLPLLTCILAIYLYPTSIVHIVRFGDIPSNPHYPYYLILYPGEELIGTVSSLPTGTSIAYIEIRGTIYDKWEPRILAADAFSNCTFKIESIQCTGARQAVTSVYIVASPIELFNMNSTDPIHLARGYESKRDKEKALSIYQALRGFFPMYRSAVLQMNMTEMLVVYYRYPHRKEPLYYLARHYRTLGNYSECLLYARAGMLVGSPIDSDLYIEKPIYGYALELEFAHCLFHSDRPMEAVNQWKHVLPRLPSAQKGEIESFLLKAEKEK